MSQRTTTLLILLVAGPLLTPVLMMLASWVPPSVAPADPYVLPMLALAIGGFGSVACWFAAIGVWTSRSSS